jgi:hypothetical protein
MPIVLTNENYYSNAANKDYMSVSQFKDLAGTLAHTACEMTGLKKAQGLIKPAKSTALLVGSYVDSYFEGTLDEFKAENPEIFKKTGDKGLKADYIQAEEIIRRICSDNLFSDYMSGQKQVIMTGNLFNTDWKIKMDSYHANDKIVDLKIMKDMSPIWSDSLRTKVDFIHYWGYDIQGAVYQKIVELNTGNKLPFYIACATKESPCDIEIIEITQPHLDAALTFVEERLPHVLALKNGSVTPEKCGTCFYCKTSKVLTKPIAIDDIMPANRFKNEDTDDSDTMTSSQPGYALFPDD